jgi:hypothetical protein
MGDLSSPWTNPGAPTPGADGQGVTSRGGDPNVSGGPSGIESIWPDPATSAPGIAETANSVSGLPGTPARWEPVRTPPAPPSLKDRMPGTIDE